MGPGGDGPKVKVTDDNTELKVSYLITSKTRSCCVVCQKTADHSCQVVPDLARTVAFIKEKIFIPKGIRCCRSHMDNNIFRPDVQIKKDGLKACPVTQELLDMCESARQLAELKLKEDYKINFDNPTMTDTEYETLTGITKSNFDDVLEKTGLYTTRLRTARQALGVLLVKLRTNLSNPVLATLFHLPSKKDVSRIVHQAREAVTIGFVPSYLGFGNFFTRDNIATEHTTKLAKHIFGNAEKPDSIILVWDGTYIYIQKSADHKFKRHTYSMHKGRPLVKPMMVVTTTGAIVDVLGPYLADGHNGDSEITHHILAQNINGMADNLEDGDIFILDRGFQHCQETLHALGIQGYMPSFTQGKQPSSQEANDTRLVTVNRWVVESANSRVKKWKLLAEIVPNSQVEYIGDYIRIVAALCNAFRPPLASDHIGDEDKAEEMLAKAQEGNTLQTEVATGPLSSRGKWENISECDVAQDFPQMSEDQVRALTFGVYQVKQAKRYISEHMREGELEIQVHQDSPGLLRCRIQSMHMNATKYFTWVEYTPERVTRWYCQCKAGARVVGCCSHVAAVIWYLAYGRHHNFIASSGVGNSIMDAEDVTLDDDESDDDTYLLNE